MNVFIQRAKGRAVALIAGESLFLVGAVALTSYLVLGDDGHGPATVWKSVLIAFVCQVCLYYADLYEFGRTGDRRDLFARILKALGFSALLMALIYVGFPALVIGQGVVAVAVILAVALAGGWRVGFVWWASRLVRRKRILIIGRNATAVALAGELQQRAELGIEIVGFVKPDDDIETIVREQSIDRVIVSLADARGKLPMDALLQMKLNGVMFDQLASAYEQYTGKIAVEDLRPSFLIFAEGFRTTRRREAIKRATDVVVSAVALTLTLPAMLAIAAAVRLTSRGPILFRQRRVGRTGRVFELIKFRSMREDAEAATGPVWAVKGDARVTPIGLFLRRTRLDELPQLWNILCGQMSIVGPRPERPEFVTALKQQIPFYEQRHMVKPGLTGWAQVRHGYGASVDDALEKLQHDLYYIKHRSMVLDALIMLETVKTVLLRRGT